MSNSLNFYDGINGQSCINFIIVFIYLFFKSEMNIFYLIFIFSISFVLLLNLKNKLFLGDGGILFFSALLSVLLIYEHNILQNIYFSDEIFFLLLLPGLDLVRLTLFRILKNKNPFYGDREHLHHLLNNKFNLTKTNLILGMLIIFPILFFVKIQNFWITILIHILLYISIIFSLKKHIK